MKLLTTPSSLSSEFGRLLRKYKQYYWASAWAGISSDAFKELVKRKERIKDIVIGLHFYQTHPDFIETFRSHKNVAFIKQSEGTFHPKVYLFYNNEDAWELLIGSANFTLEAFTRNTEAMVLIGNDDTGAEKILAGVWRLLEKCNVDAERFTKKELDNYRVAWQNHRPKRQSLSGRYGGGKPQNKPIYEAPIANLSWEGFISKVVHEYKHGPKKRMKILKFSRNKFEDVPHFNELETEERKMIAGIPNFYDHGNEIDWGYFGSMQGAGIYKNKIIENDANISKALDQIPLHGQVTRIHYDNFIHFYKKAFSGNYLATATRLLAMKRPDVFVCLDSKNISKLCKDFGVKRSGLDYDRYWTEIILRIYDCEWWVNPKPKTNLEKEISNARSAFLDALYYEY